MSAVQVEMLLAGLRDTSGNPLGAGKIYTYEAGTTTNKTTWEDIDKSVAETNPIILDGNGRKLVFADGSYKFVIKDSDDVTLYTFDDLRFSIGESQARYGGDSGGSSNAYTLTLATAPTAYADGDSYLFRANHSNTTAATINVNSLGVKSIVNSDGTTLSANQIRSNEFVTVVFNVAADKFYLKSSDLELARAGSKYVLFDRGYSEENVGMSGFPSSYTVVDDCTLDFTDLEVGDIVELEFATQASYSQVSDTYHFAFHHEISGGSATAITGGNLEQASGSHFQSTAGNRHRIHTFTDFTIATAGDYTFDMKYRRNSGSGLIYMEYRNFRARVLRPL